MRYEKLEAQQRAERGTKACRALRGQQSIPAVVYGGKDADAKPNRVSESIVIDQKSFQNWIHDGVRFFDIVVGSEETTTVVKELQWHPIFDTVLHADFERVSLDSPVPVLIPLVYKGEAKGLKAGGKVMKHMMRVRVAGLPRDLPEEIVVRLDDLDAGESLKLGELTLPEGVELAMRSEAKVVEVKIKSRASSEDEEAEEEAAS